MYKRQIEDYANEVVSFVLGILGLVWVEHPIVLTLHRTISIVLIILLAIHIYKSFIED